MRFALLCLAVTVLITAGCKTSPDYGYKKPFSFGPDAAKVKTYEDGSFRATYDRLAATDREAALVERNRILHELMYFTDAAHGQFCRDAIAKKAALDLGSDLAILGLSGAGTVVGGEGTKAILAAISGGIQGAQLATNKRVFREQAIEALQAQMRAAMMKRKAEILQRMKQGVGDYPLDLGLSDIVEYYHDGTFSRAFQNLVAESKKQEVAAEQQVSTVIRFQEDASAKILRLWLFPAGPKAPDLKRADQLRDWFSKQNFKPKAPKIEVFLEDPQYKDDRQRAVKELVD